MNPDTVPVWSFLSILILASSASAQLSFNTLVSPTPTPANATANTDLNGDGQEDFAFGGPNGLGILPRGGPPAVVPLTGTAPNPAGSVMALEAADLTGDGVRDLVVVTGDISPRVHLVSHVAGGGFAELASVPLGIIWLQSGGFGLDVAVGDTDGDGDLDIAVVAESLPFHPGSPTGGTVVIENQGLGFLSVVTNTLLPASCAAYADVDGDTFVDLLTSNAWFFTPADVSWYPGNGTGTFGAPPMTIPIGTGRVAQFIARDLDCDGDPDLLVVNRDHQAAETATLLLNDGTGVFSAVQAITIGEFFTMISLAADLDRDGDEDAVFLGSSGSVEIFENRLRSNGTMTRTTFPSGLGPLGLFGPPFGLSVGDFDQNGQADVMTSHGLNDTVAVLLNQATAVVPGPFLGPAAAGTVAPRGGTSDILTVDGTAGGASRRIDLALGQGFVIDLANPPIAGAPADFVIFGDVGVPSCGEEFSFGPVIGTMVFPPCVVQPTDPGAFVLASSFGTTPVCTPLVNAGPAPFTLAVPSGLPAPVTFALQGLVVQSPGAFRVTNGVLLRIE